MLPLMQRVLGDAWALLPSVLQKHYQITDTQSSCLAGHLTIAYPKFMMPIVWIIHLFGGLILWPGELINITVQKHSDANGIIYWRRKLNYPDGKADYFYSTMTYIAEHELAETIGFGFGLYLTVNVVNGDLCYQSNGHFWHAGKLKVKIPDCFVLGRALITEHALSEQEFLLDFTISHPLWGTTYSYQGVFSYA